MPRLVVGPSTAVDWTATCIEDSLGVGTWPRTTLCSYAVASSSKLTVSGVTLSIVTATSVGYGTRYVLSP
jgi:hypothetical protein